MLHWLGSLQIHEFYQTQHRLVIAQEQGPKICHSPKERKVEASGVEVEDEWNCAVTTKDRKDHILKPEIVGDDQEAKDKVEELCQVFMDKEKKC